MSPTILLPVFPSIAPVLEQQRIDPSALEGMMEWIYDVPNRLVEFHLLKLPVPTSVLRTTGYGPNLFALESFVDELAQAAGRDAYRVPARTARTQSARTCRARSRRRARGMEQPVASRNTALGIAVAHAFGTYHRAGRRKHASTRDALELQRIVSVVDCGRVLDPGIARQGIEGGTVFGIAGCKAEVTFRAWPGRP